LLPKSTNWTTLVAIESADKGSMIARRNQNKLAPVASVLLLFVSLTTRFKCPGKQ
jgi:hypothetical protein